MSAAASTKPLRYVGRPRVPEGLTEYEMYQVLLVRFSDDLADLDWSTFDEILVRGTDGDEEAVSLFSTSSRAQSATRSILVIKTDRPHEEDELRRIKARLGAAANELGWTA